MTLLSCTNLSVATPAGPLFTGLNLTIQSGQCWGVLGPNGCGKSSLLHCLSGLDAPATGDIRLGQQRLDAMTHRTRARLIGLLPQESPYSFPLSVLDAVVSGRFAHQSWFGTMQRGERDLALAALTSLGIAAFAKRDVSSLSGGEKRKVALATLLCQAPSIALLDEPENHLDPGARQRILTQFKTDFTQGDKAILMVMQDPTLALRLCSHLLIIDAQGQLHSGPVEHLATDAMLSQLYGHPLNVISTKHGKVAVAL